MRGFRYKKTASQSDTILHVSPTQRAVQSPEPEGSEMMLHHSIYKLAEKINFVKQKNKNALLYNLCCSDSF